MAGLWSCEERIVLRLSGRIRFHQSSRQQHGVVLDLGGCSQHSVLALDLGSSSQPHRECQKSRVCWLCNFPEVDQGGPPLINIKYLSHKTGFNLLKNLFQF